MARRASDEELLVGALHARIERWLELEGIFAILGFGDVELAGELDWEPAADSGHGTWPDGLLSPAGCACTWTVVPYTRAASNKALSISAARSGRSRGIQVYQLRVSRS